MRATEARRLAEFKADADFREYFDKVMEQIKIHAKLGQFEIIYFGKFPKSVESEIKSLGYTVERKRAEYNNTDLIIKW